MIELDKHIEILLMNNDCVIIPEFGGFMAHHIDAEYEHTDNTFFPPIRTIGFNPQLKINDSLLVQSYIEVYDISYPEAYNKIMDEVQEIKQHIENNGKYELNGIGSIKKNNLEAYIFEPLESGLLTPSLYGLSTFELMPITKSVNNEIVETQLDTIKPNFAISSILFPEKELQEEKTITVKINLLRNIAVACIIIILFLLYPVSLENKSYSSIGMSNFEPSLFQNLISKDLKHKTKTNKTQKKVNNNDNLFIQPKGSNIYYGLVLVSCIPESNAKEYVENLLSKGYKDIKILKRTNGCKVVYGTFYNIELAQKKLNQLRSSDIFKDAWIMKIKN